MQIDELVAKLRMEDRGYYAHGVIHFAIATGKIQRPALNSIGQLEFTAEHLDELRQLFPRHVST